jgi:hypothetical protein
MKAGPKGHITAPPLDLRRLPKRGGSRAGAFIERYVTVPKGTGARRRLRLRPWQRQVIHGLLDEPRPRQGLVSIPAGNGKSTLAAALGLYGLLADGVEGAQVLVVASDERQARIIFNTARRMVELDRDLAARVHVYADRLHEPRSDSVFMALPADPGSLQGWDPSMALVDELHVVTDDTFEAMAARAGKRDRSLLLAISTPPKTGQDDSVMRRLVDHGRDGGDPSFFFREFAAPAGCRLDDEAAWAIANPALDDFLHRDALRATLPPKMRRTRSAGTGSANGSAKTTRGCPMARGPPAPTPPGASRTAPTSSSRSTGRSRGTAPPWPWPPSTSGPMWSFTASGRRLRAAATGACPSSRSRTPSGRRARGGVSRGGRGPLPLAAVPRGLGRRRHRGPRVLPDRGPDGPGDGPVLPAGRRPGADPRRQ